MNTTKLASCILPLIVLINIAQGWDVTSHDRIVACYVGTWSIYRPGAGRFGVEHVDPGICTHVVYAFAGLQPDTMRITSLDPGLELSDGQGYYRKFTNLKRLNPRLKVTIAVGGWSEGSEKYSQMTSNKQLRQTFINSVVQFLDEHDFDGLDLDWEYPGRRGGAVTDKHNFVELIKELRSAFVDRRWLLTAAVAAMPATARVAYNVPEMTALLDYMHVMSYDYHGKWNGFSGHNAPLNAPASEASVNSTISYYLEAGANASRLLLGVPLYGRTFRLEDANSHEVGDSTENTAFSGPYTREDGLIAFNEMCVVRERESIEWTERWDEVASAPYLYRQQNWVSIENRQSITKKVEFAMMHGLAGVMVWTLDMDDFGGVCHDGNFPLLDTINQVLTTAARDTGMNSSSETAVSTSPHTPQHMTTSSTKHSIMSDSSVVKHRIHNASGCVHSDLLQWNSIVLTMLVVMLMSF